MTRNPDIYAERLGADVKHTPTPWQVHPGPSNYIGPLREARAEAVTPEDAALIVQAVNARAALETAKGENDA